MSRPPKRPRSASPSNHLETTIKDDATWTDGNFEVISSDDVRFRVPLYVLLAASGMFRDAWDLSAAGGKVALTDEEIETAHVLRMFLTLATTHSLSFPEDKLTGGQELARLLVKWRCDALVTTYRAILAVIIKPARMYVVALDVFVIGALLDDPQLCSSALAHPCSIRRYHETSERANSGKGMTAWEPCNWGMDLWRTVPIEYSVALVRSWDVWTIGRKINSTFVGELSKIQAARRERLPQ